MEGIRKRDNIKDRMTISDRLQEQHGVEWLERDENGIDRRRPLLTGKRTYNKFKKHQIRQYC